MIIKVDEQGKIAINALCDLALKVKGLECMKDITLIQDSTELIKEDKKQDVEAKE